MRYRKKKKYHRAIILTFSCRRRRYFRCRETIRQTRLGRKDIFESTNFGHLVRYRRRYILWQFSCTLSRTIVSSRFWLHCLVSANTCGEKKRQKYLVRVNCLYNLLVVFNGILIRDIQGGGALLSQAWNRGYHNQNNAPYKHMLIYNLKISPNWELQSENWRERTLKSLKFSFDWYHFHFNRIIFLKICTITEVHFFFKPLKL
jgi:hypothetical protein